MTFLETCFFRLEKLEFRQNLEDDPSYLDKWEKYSGKILFATMYFVFLHFSKKYNLSFSS